MFKDFLYMYGNLSGYLCLVGGSFFHISYLVDKDEYVGAVVALCVWVVLLRRGLPEYIRLGTAWDTYRKNKVFYYFWYVFGVCSLVSLSFKFDWRIDIAMFAVSGAIATAAIARNIEKGLSADHLRYMKNHSFADYVNLIEQKPAKNSTSGKK